MKKRVLLLVITLMLFACLICVSISCEAHTNEPIGNGVGSGVDIDEVTENILYQLNEDSSGAVVVGIGGGFQGERIVIPDTTEINKKEYPVIEIGAKALQNFDTVKSVKLPVSLKKIGESAFFDCDILESIAIP